MGYHYSLCNLSSCSSITQGNNELILIWFEYAHLVGMEINIIRLEDLKKNIFKWAKEQFRFSSSGILFPDFFSF